MRTIAFLLNKRCDTLICQNKKKIIVKECLYSSILSETKWFISISVVLLRQFLKCMWLIYHRFWCQSEMGFYLFAGCILYILRIALPTGSIGFHNRHTNFWHITEQMLSTETWSMDHAYTHSYLVNANLLQLVMSTNVQTQSQWLLLRPGCGLSWDSWILDRQENVAIVVCFSVFTFIWYCRTR